MDKEFILFTGEHCAGCKPMKEKVRVFLEKHPDIKYTEINIDKEENESWIIRYQVRSVPTLIVIKNGNIMNTIVGNVNIDNLEV